MFVGCPHVSKDKFGPWTEEAKSVGAVVALYSSKHAWSRVAWEARGAGVGAKFGAALSWTPGIGDGGEGLDYSGSRGGLLAVGSPGFRCCAIAHTLHKKRTDTHTHTHTHTHTRTHSRSRTRTHPSALSHSRAHTHPPPHPPRSPHRGNTSAAGAATGRVDILAGASGARRLSVICGEHKALFGQSVALVSWHAPTASSASSSSRRGGVALFIGVPGANLTRSSWLHATTAAAGRVDVVADVSAFLKGRDVLAPHLVTGSVTPLHAREPLVHFGRSIAATTRNDGDGVLLAVGAPLGSRGGSAHVFADAANSAGARVQRLTSAAEKIPAGRLGSALAFAADGRRVLVGAPKHSISQTCNRCGNAVVMILPPRAVLAGPGDTEEEERGKEGHGSRMKGMGGREGAEERGREEGELTFISSQ